MDDVIKSLEKLVYSIALKFTHDKSMIEDLYQQGMLGVINAFNNYDESLNVKFSTYARMYIYGEIYNYYNCNKSIKLNKSIVKTYFLINKAKELLAQNVGREPSVCELSEYLNISEEDITNILNMVQMPLSLEYEYDDNNSMYNFINDDSSNNLYIDELLSYLDENQRNIIMYKYFDGYNQTEIAKMMNISQAKVSREERSGIEKIRSRYKSVV